MQDMIIGAPGHDFPISTIDTEGVGMLRTSSGKKNGLDHYTARIQRQHAALRMGSKIQGCLLSIRDGEEAITAMKKYLLYRQNKQSHWRPAIGLRSMLGTVNAAAVHSF